MLKHLRIRFPVFAGFLLVFVGLYVSEQLGLYYSIPFFDKVMHFVGGMIAAWFVLALMQEEITHMRWWKQAIIIVSVTAFIGVIWEWAEYLSNYTRATAPWFYRYFSGGNLVDTLGDLVADTVGGLAITIWALRKERT